MNLLKRFELPKNINQAFAILVYCVILTLVSLPLPIYANWRTFEIRRRLYGYAQIIAEVTDTGCINPQSIFDGEKYLFDPDFAPNANSLDDVRRDHDGFLYTGTTEWQEELSQEIISRALIASFIVNTQVFNLRLFRPTMFFVLITSIFLIHWLIIRRKCKPIVLYPQASTWGESELIIELSFNKCPLLAKVEKGSNLSVVTIFVDFLYIVWIMWTLNALEFYGSPFASISLLVGIIAALMLHKFPDLALRKKNRKNMPEKLTLYENRILFDDNEFHFRDIKEIRIDNPDYINSLNTTDSYANIIICEEYKTSSYVLKDMRVIGSEVLGGAAYNDFCIELEKAVYRYISTSLI